LEKPLELPADKGPHLLHTLPIDAKVTVARPGSRAEVNGLRVVVENKFNIIDEPKEQGGEFIMQVGLVFFNEFGAGQGRNGSLQGLLRFSPRLPIAKRRNGMPFVCCLG
jgi:hypothetical protein